MSAALTTDLETTPFPHGAIVTAAHGAHDRAQLRPATWPRPDPHAARLLWIDPGADRFEHALVGGLPGLVAPGDLLVVNDAATIPASLLARTANGAPIEVRLAGVIPEMHGSKDDGASRGSWLGEADFARTHGSGDRGAAPGRAPGADGTSGGQATEKSHFTEENRAWAAVTFGEGDWRVRTEDRPAPPVLRSGERLAFEGGLTARIEQVSDLSPRLVTLRFDLEGAALWDALYRAGRPVQYSYLDGSVALWHVQTRYASVPMAVEPASAGLALTWDLITVLRRRGVQLARITQAAGLSSTGDPAIDAALPLPERFEIPQATVRAIDKAKSEGGRVVAIGTTVVRALEGCAALHGGRLVPGRGTTGLRIGHGHRLLIVDGLLTGIHEPGTSHYEMLRAFAPEALLDRAHAEASKVGYLGHEFGDTCLILGSR